MNTVFWAINLIFLAFVVHVMIWRTRRPPNSGVALLIIFMIIGLIAIALFFFWSWRHGSEINGPALTQTVLLYFAGMAGYINTYPAIEADSPSLLLAYELRLAGSVGLTKSEIMARFNDDFVFLPRLQNLIDEKIVETVDGRLLLTAKGRAIARIFFGFRCLTGRKFGG